MTHPGARLVFDLDGTLSDNSLGICRCVNYALERHGWQPRPQSELLSYIGVPLDAIFSELTDGAPDHVRACVDSYRERYSDVGYRENRLYDGIAEALAELRARGHRLGVCTSKRTDFAERIIDMFQLDPCFDFVNGADVGLTKTEQLARLVADGRVDPSGIMIGDREIDMLAGSRNGLAVAAVRWGFGSERELQRTRPDWLLSTPAELLSLI